MRTPFQYLLFNQTLLIIELKQFFDQSDADTDNQKLVSCVQPCYFVRLSAVSPKDARMYLESESGDSPDLQLTTAESKHNIDERKMNENSDYNNNISGESDLIEIKNDIKQLQIGVW